MPPRGAPRDRAAATRAPGFTLDDVDDLAHTLRSGLRLDDPAPAEGPPPTVVINVSVVNHGTVGGDLSVTLSSTGNEAQAASSSSASASGAASSEAPPARRRASTCYAVWVVPGARAAVVGVHVPRSGGSCWNSVRVLIPGGHYRPGLDRLRGFGSQEEAVAAFREEAGRHGVEQEPRIFLW